MIEQDQQEIFARAGLFGREEAFAEFGFLSFGFSREHALESLDDKFVIVSRGKTLRQGVRLSDGDFAVGQSKGLLRHDAGTPLVTFGDARAIEDFQKLHFFLRGDAQVNASALRGEAEFVMFLRVLLLRMEDARIQIP